MEYPNPVDEIGTDLFQQKELVLERASLGKRFANYIIDFVAFLVFIVLVFSVLIVAIPDTADALADTPPLLDRLVSMFLFGLFMGAQEAIFKGRSLGKLCTGTRAVNKYDGSTISAGTAFQRGFSRAVPFEPFSALGQQPWHDKWTDTMVVDNQRSAYL